MSASNELRHLESPSTLADSSCRVFQSLLAKPITTTQLQGHPCVSEVRRCGESGCVSCKLIWDGISCIFPGLGTWDETTAFGFVLRENDVEWLRIGIVRDSGDNVRGVPRERVDFHWISDESWESPPVVDQDSSQSEQVPRIVGQVDRVRDTTNEINKSQFANRASLTVIISQIRSWMSMCQSSHSTCRLPKELPNVPTRLIETDLGDGTLDVALREYIAAPEPYIALSYCWGRSLSLRTLPCNLESHKTRITWSALPVLFRDVVLIARLLRVRYVWIDALCIIQKDSSDWTTEGASMAAYYGNALLTVAADASIETTCTSLPRSVRQSTVLAVADTSTKVKASKVPVHVSMKSVRFDKNPPSCMPLFSRAWAFQERLMSARILHLGPEEMVWECSSQLWCECGMPPDIWNGRPEPSIEPFRASHHNALASGTNLAAYWHDLLEMYLIRHMTFSTDKLKATMGVAGQINNSQDAKSQTLGSYVLGLWSSILQHSLLWSSLTRGCSRNDKFPSWSWASMDGTWLYQRPPRVSQFVPKATIIKRPLELWDVDEGVTCRYELVISGLAVNAVLVASDSFPAQGLVQWTVCTGYSSDGDMELTVDLDVESQRHGEGWDPAVLCLQLGVSDIYSKKRAWGLVLRATKDDDTVFERVGVMTASEEWYNVGAQKRDVVVY
ncbi:heterokaryon incompatibility protein-domain-containing protein [Ilyonectria sp. MPI-CAGE-AT-0026]|nr:heterokaryon incompatibility protein-domain-containing protein [Ilyonectria sp. MPI-CAGE-AT-0026]